MAAAWEAGVEVIALADHNDVPWMEEMMEAGQRAGIVVFPGVEITTGSGADGIHLIIIGDRNKTRDDFMSLLTGACGYGERHPRFNPADRSPASSPRTAIDILDELPDGYLVIAPHAFNDNGIASSRTVRGDLRWKTLHHDRLGAVDVGDVRQLTDPTSWKYRFAHRELDHFPGLPSLAFVSTSDAYTLDELGARWTWVRMSVPTIEGLRQAFLDHEARIICDWDSRYAAEATPNEIGHAWVESISLEQLTTSADPVSVSFHPRLNVIIGGRGSGKSTIVAGLRCLYGGTATLPPQAQAEATELVNAVFPNATVRAHHRLAHSAEEQTAEWDRDGGSLTGRTEGADATPTPTDFKVRIINQKELFERAAHSTSDPFSTSRNLLALVDDALATGTGGPGGPAAFAADLNDAQTAWISAARSHQSEVEATAQRGVVAARVGELQRQVAAFDSEESRSRRERNDRLLGESDALDGAVKALQELVWSVEHALGPEPEEPEPAMGTDDPAALDFRARMDNLGDIERTFRQRVEDGIAATREALAAVEEGRGSGPWAEAHAAALEDAERYRAELAALGIDPDEYDRVRSQLATQSQLLAQLDERVARLADLKNAADVEWGEVETLLDGLRSSRQALLDEVAERSEMLRFSLVPRADIPQWVRSVRDLLNLRADGFLPDVPALGDWLWADVDPTERERRAGLWREACITGNFDALIQETGMRPAWADRLAGLDPVLRARLGSTTPDDTVEMQFLTEGGDRDVETDWKPLTAGSPGQRSAAMLSFVLHHGVDPLVLDQPEDDLDTEWITDLVVRQLRLSRWVRQVIVVTHNANIPVNADAERVITMENHAGGIRVRTSERPDGTTIEHAGGLEEPHVREDVQRIMEGGVAAFVRRELRYHNELNRYRAAMQSLTAGE
jgi:hypothetical protein